MKVATALGVSKNRLKKACAEAVVAYTGRIHKSLKALAAANTLNGTNAGFEVDGVAPCGWTVPPFAAFIEDRCFEQEAVWCGAGTKPAMFSCSPDELLRISGGQRISLSPHVWPG
jgi:prolyl-tRNA editing enzyme YbaK/EbsC (Cys-tRNA(Pro) deacylase)